MLLNVCNEKKTLMCGRERVVNTSSLEVSLQQLKPATAYDVTVVAVSQDGISTQGSRITVQTNSEGWIVLFLLQSLF